MDFINMNESKDDSGIYLIINTINNFVYVGQTKQKFKKRYWHHCWKLNDNSHDNIHLQCAWNKYGADAFQFVIKESVDDFEKLNELEEKYISMYREQGKCYNIQDGGQKTGGYERTDEWKKVVGEKNRQHMLGRKHSEETKRKMSESHKGNHYNKDNYILNEELAYEVKTRLMKGEKPSLIANDLNIPYKTVNGILSNNTWECVHIDGWDEFRNNRKTWSRFSYEDCVEVYELYISGKYTQQELADMYGKTRHSIANAIKKVEKSK